MNAAIITMERATALSQDIGQSKVIFSRPADLDPAWNAAWDDLAENASEPNSFLERFFVTASLTHIADAKGLRVATVWDGNGTLIGVTMFFLARRYGRMVLKHVQTWSHYHSFLGTPLVRKGQEEQFWRTLIDGLDSADWADGLIHLTGLTEGGIVHRALITATNDIGRACDTVHRSERALLESELSPQAYYEAAVRKKKRKEIGRLQSRLQELGAVEYSSAKTAEDVALFTEQFLALEAAGWKGKAGSALDCTPETGSFFRAVTHASHAAGKLDFQKLSLDGQPLAMLVNFIAFPGAFSYKIAFDESFARFSPGVLIQLENLKILDDARFGWMDSCAVENHSMINSLWAERRNIIRVSIPLGGLKRGMVFRFCRTAEESWAQIKKLKGRPKPQSNRDEGQSDD